MAQTSFSNLSFHSNFEKEAFQQIYTDPDQTDYLALFLAMNPSMDSTTYEDIRTDLKELNNKTLRTSPRKLFYELQLKYFQQYSQYNGTSELLQDSVYNCVSGTAVIASLYNENDIDFTVKELPYHIYLVVHKNNRDYVVESTAETFGYRRLTKQVRKFYQQDTVDMNWCDADAVSGTCADLAGITVKNNISLKQLVGISYYNEAIELFNKQDYSTSIQFLEKALFLYNSPRIKYLLVNALKFEMLHLQEESLDYQTHQLRLQELTEPIYSLSDLTK